MEQLFVKALKTSAEKNLGYNHKQKKSRGPNIQPLSLIYNDINMKFDSIKDEQEITKKQRNKIMTQTHNIIKNGKSKTLSNMLQKTLKETKMIL